MNKFQWLTLFVVLVCFLIMGIWDAFAIYSQGRRASISYLITMATFHVPLVAFLFGVLAGHLFWPQAGYPQDVTPVRRVVITVDEKGNVVSIRETFVERID